MEEASTAAELAFERANGARWRLEVAQKALRDAQAKARQAAADVASQRDGIVYLVTESYQNGTELNTASALVSDEGPNGLMNRYGVVQSAGDSMEARYEHFKVASARAKTFTERPPRPRRSRRRWPRRPRSSPSPPARPRPPRASPPTRSPCRSRS